MGFNRLSSTAIQNKTIKAGFHLRRSRSRVNSENETAGSEAEQ